MKQLTLAIFGLHLLLASICMMPTAYAHADAASAHTAEHSSDAANHDSTCAGGQCIVQANQPESKLVIPIVTVAYAPSVSNLVNTPASIFAHRDYGDAPLVIPLIKTIVLRL